MKKLFFAFCLLVTSACKQNTDHGADSQTLKTTKLTLQGPKNIYLFAYSPMTNIRPAGEDLCWYYAEVSLWGKKIPLEQVLKNAQNINRSSVQTAKLYNKYTQDILINVASIALSMKGGTAACAATATGVGAVLTAASCAISAVTLVTSGVALNNSSKAQQATDKSNVSGKLIGVNSGGIDAIREAVLKSEWNAHPQDQCLSASDVIRHAKQRGQVFTGDG